MAERKAPASKPRKAAPKKAASKVTAPEPTADETPVQDPHPAPPDSPGFIGEVTDPTPNEHYSLQGVIAGKPVPEHDR